LFSLWRDLDDEDEVDGDDDALNVVVDVGEGTVLWGSWIEFARVWRLKVVL
jgi:hypothetical protein